MNIPARRGYTVALIVVCAVMNLSIASFGGNWALALGNNWFFTLRALGTLVGIVAPFFLMWREKRPYVVSLIASGVTLLFQLDSLFAIVGIAGLVARRSNRHNITLCAAFAYVASVMSYVVDLSAPMKYSLILTFFGQGGNGEAVHTASGMLNVTGWLICLFVPAILMGIGVFCGIAMRNAAVSRRSLAQARSEKQRADDIQTSLSNKQIADSIAAEAHDTLAHSLSLIAVNATTLGADVEKLRQAPTDSQLQASIQRKSDDLRSQAAGALDEAHSIIDMLRHPDSAARLLAPGEETALTQDALDALFADVRESGTELRLWVDIRGLSALSPNVGKVAFRAVQEGLTNARRHAPGVPVSLSISVIPTKGITISMTNPVPLLPQEGTQTGVPTPGGTSMPLPSGMASGAHGGNGLKGLAPRVEECKGTCAYGTDRRSVFHLDVSLPFVPIS